VADEIDGPVVGEDVRAAQAREDRMLDTLGVGDAVDEQRRHQRGPN
jgi:hypothetical protein